MIFSALIATQTLLTSPSYEVFEGKSHINVHKSTRYQSQPRRSKPVFLVQDSEILVIPSSDSTLPISSSSGVRLSLGPQVSFFDISKYSQKFPERTHIDIQLRETVDSVEELIGYNSDGNLGENSEIKRLILDLYKFNQEYKKLQDKDGQLKTLEILAFLHFGEGKVKSSLALAEQAKISQSLWIRILRDNG